MGFEHGTTQQSTTQCSIQQSMAHYNTTQHNTAPAAAQESLPPSLSPSTYHLPACVVKVGEGMPPFLFQVVLCYGRIK